ncbi:LCI fold-containing protein [Bacillus thuringiensis]|uniref:LCI fold-containing protein n=1 Tax=Bacillus thuringiensis TaxID=1428 RepID=UPI000BF757D8|nr:LCI fold-containing protein [Bacillus thuringiensis]PFD62276.1 hypothetical protein CN274_00130 [Bacillus thuringiensis]
MFKKLVVGALATGIALTGGIGAASASTEAPTKSASYQYDSCYDSGAIFQGGNTYVKYLHNTVDRFANSYTDSEGYTWYFKRSYYKPECGTYEAYYEGRK